MALAVLYGVNTGLFCFIFEGSFNLSIIANIGIIYCKTLIDCANYLPFILKSV